MKKTLFTLGLAAVCALAMTGCQEKIDTAPDAASLSESTPFELQVGFDATKITTDDQFKVEWEEGDKINVFHALAGSNKYINDGVFTVKEAGAKGIFSGKVQGVLYPSKKYDWYVIYPYHELTTTPEKAVFRFNEHQETPDNGGIQNIQSQKLPLWSNIKGLSGNVTPSLMMHQVYSIAKVTVNNINCLTMTLDNFRIDGSVSNSVFTRTSGLRLSGDADIDLTGDKVKVSPGTFEPTDEERVRGVRLFTPDHSTVNYSGRDVKIKHGDSWTVYLPIYPQVLPAESSLFITPRGYAGKYISFFEPFEFKAGTIHEFIINMDKTEQYLTEKQLADGIFFRFCYDRDNMEVKFLGSNGWWEKKKAGKFFSNYDHLSAIREFNESEEGNNYYWKSYISVEPKMSDASLIRYSANENRYFLPIAKQVKDGAFAVTTNVAKLAAGKKLVFHTSVFLADADACKSYRYEYSVDGGATYAPAKVVAEDPKDKVEGNVLTFNIEESNLCHPIVVSTDAMAADVVNGTIIIRMTFLEDNTKYVGFAPYYRFNGELRRFTSKIEGAYVNPEACAYLTVE